MATAVLTAPAPARAGSAADALVPTLTDLAAVYGAEGAIGRRCAGPFSSAPAGAR